MSVSSLILLLGSSLAPDMAAHEVTVEALALPSTPSYHAFPVTRLTANDLSRNSAARLDEQLRTVPGFGLFRRNSSLGAHPTAQGVSLRSIGPSGAGRTLVLVDGVPANDPFGGWVYWSNIASSTIEQIDIIRGGGAGPYGNTALAGTIKIATRLPKGTGGYADISAGSKSTFSGVGGAWTSHGAMTLDVGGQIFDSGGYMVVSQDQRGSVDLPTASRGTRGQVGLTYRGDDMTLRAEAIAFEEDRDNGTAGAKNHTRSREASLRIVGTGETAYEATVWVIDRRFKSSFTSVNATRTDETPALDQFHTPATAVGGNVFVRKEIFSGTLEFGGDLKWIDGETNEYYSFQNNAFRNVRRAGGQQLLGGIFGDYTARLHPNTHITLGLRLDYLSNYDGSRKEQQISTSQSLTDQTYKDQSRLRLNGRLGVSHKFSDDLDGRLSIYSGFRNPTINELYRPFRVRNDITEANPALSPEQIIGADLGFDWTPSATTRVSVTGFVTRLNNPITAILLSRTPGNHPEFGVFLPAGGSLNQRQNLDRLDTYGLELEVSGSLTPTFQISGRYLLSHGTFHQKGSDITGHRPPQAARHQATLGLDWAATSKFRISADGRIESHQFEDANNSRKLPGYATVNMMARYEIDQGVEIYTAVENLFDREIVSGISTDGLKSLAAPRLFRAGIRAKF